MPRIDSIEDVGAQAVLLDGGEVVPGLRRTGGEAGQVRGQAGLALEQVLGADQGEQPGRLVPAEAGDVPLGLDDGVAQGVQRPSRKLGGRDAGDGSGTVTV